VKKGYITPVILVIISLWFLISFAEGAQTKPRKKIHPVRKAQLKGKKRTYASVAAVKPVLDTKCSNTASDIQRSMTEAINRWSNTRYKYGGMSQKGIDCSGFTYRVFQRALGYTLPRTSIEQANVGEVVDKDSLTFGDLLFFYSKSKRHKRINHVGIYISDGTFVHSHRHHGVGIDSLDKAYYARHFALAKRVVALGVDDTEREE
jgi:cell wall-associated NlpC family hydrolase